MATKTAPESPTVGSTPAGIAYRADGAGYPDLLLIPDGLIPMAAFGRFAPYASFLDELRRMGRLVLYDRRGIGASASAARGRPFGLAAWADDAADVLIATGSVRAIVIALAEGAMTAVALAAKHPERVAALVLLNATPGPALTPLARRGQGPGYIDYLRSTLPHGWAADLPGLEVVAPSLGRDPAFSAWLTDAFRQAGDARRFLPAFDLALRSDVRSYLSRVRSPTMVVHRRADAWFSADHGRLLANAIGGSRYVELPGADHAPYVGTTGDVFSAIRWFMAETFPTSLSRAYLPPDSSDILSRRQAQVLRFVRDGLTDKEVAARLGLSHRTVQKHLELAYRRLGVHNRTAATASSPSSQTARTRAP